MTQDGNSAKLAWAHRALDEAFVGVFNVIANDNVEQAKTVFQ